MRVKICKKKKTTVSTDKTETKQLSDVERVFHIMSADTLRNAAIVIRCGFRICLATSDNNTMVSSISKRHAITNPTAAKHRKNEILKKHGTIPTVDTRVRLLHGYCR